MLSEKTKRRWLALLADAATDFPEQVTARYRGKPLGGGATLPRREDVWPDLFKAMQALLRGDKAAAERYLMSVCLTCCSALQNERGGHKDQRSGRRKGRVGSYMNDAEALRYARKLQGRRGAAMAAAKVIYGDATPEQLKTHAKRIRRKLNRGVDG